MNDLDKIREMLKKDKEENYKSVSEKDAFIFYDMENGKIINSIVNKAITTENASLLETIECGCIKAEEALISDNRVLNKTAGKLFSINAYLNRNNPKPEKSNDYDRQKEILKQKIKEKLNEKLNSYSPPKEEIKENIIEKEIPNNNIIEEEIINDIGDEQEMDFKEQLELIESNRRKMATTPEPASENKNYEKMLSSSFTPIKHESVRNRFNIKITKKQIVKYGLYGVIGVAACLGITKVTTEALHVYQGHVMNQAMASVLVPPNAENKPTILERNTHYTEDFQDTWFDNQKIAWDILHLPNEAFDAALFTVYEDMGEDRVKNYVDNWEKVIQTIGRDAKQNKHPLGYARCHGVKSFDEYLIKNGFVDKHGDPDVDKFVSYGKKAVAAYYDSLKNYSDQRDALDAAEKEVNSLGR